MRVERSRGIQSVRESDIMSTRETERVETQNV